MATQIERRQILGGRGYAVSDAVFWASRPAPSVTSTLALGVVLVLIVLGLWALKLVTRGTTHRHRARPQPPAQHRRPGAGRRPPPAADHPPRQCRAPDPHRRPAGRRGRDRHPRSSSRQLAAAPSGRTAGGGRPRPASASPRSSSCAPSCGPARRASRRRSAIPACCVR